jgi:hypothetical protein
LLSSPFDACASPPSTRKRLQINIMAVLVTTTLFATKPDVDARNKSGHDDMMKRMLAIVDHDAKQDYAFASVSIMITALREWS